MQVGDFESIRKTGTFLCVVTDVLHLLLTIHPIIQVSDVFHPFSDLAAVQTILQWLESGAVERSALLRIVGGSFFSPCFDIGSCILSILRA